MIPASHNLAATIICDNMNKSLNINKSKFCYGAVLPDFSPTYAFIPHYKKDSFAFVVSSIKTVKQAIDLKALSIDDLSIQLGIIAHYLMDFFCFAHNDKHMDQFPHHIFYEINLHSHLKSFIKEKDSSLTKEIFFSNIPNLHVLDFIESSHQEYLRSVSGALNDIRFSLKVAFSVIQSMISDCNNSLIFIAA